MVPFRRSATKARGRLPAAAPAPHGAAGITTERLKTPWPPALPALSLAAAACLLYLASELYFLSGGLALPLTIA